MKRTSLDFQVHNVSMIFLYRTTKFRVSVHVTNEGGDLVLEVSASSVVNRVFIATSLLFNDVCTYLGVDNISFFIT